MSATKRAAAPAGTVGAVVRPVHPWKVWQPWGNSRKAKAAQRQMLSYRKRTNTDKPQKSLYLRPNKEVSIER